MIKLFVHENPVQLFLCQKLSQKREQVPQVSLLIFYKQDISNITI